MSTTKAEDLALHNLKERRLWEEHVCAIFNGLLASTALITASLVVLLMVYIHIAA